MAQPPFKIQKTSVERKDTPEHGGQRRATVASEMTTHHRHNDDKYFILNFKMLE